MLTLKNVLTINALSSGVTGLLLIVLSSSFAQWFEVQSTSIFTGTGVFLVTFAVFVYAVGHRKPIDSRLVKLIIGLDITWVVASLLVMVVDYSFISGLGLFLIAAVAFWVAVMVYLQTTGLKTFVRIIIIGFIVFAGQLPSGFAQPAKAEASVKENPLARSKSQSLEVVSSFLDAVISDHAKIPYLLDSLIQWHQPGNNQLAGVRSNVKEVYKLFGGFKELSAGTLTLTYWKVLAVHGNQVACLMHWQASQPVGRVLDVDNIDVYTVEKGKITKVVVYTADPEQEDKFWMK